MAANTVSAWSETRVGYKGSSLYKASCTVLADTANQMAYTLKTPRGLDVRRPWSLVISTSAASDGQAVPADLYLGTGDTAALSGTSSITATAAVKFKQLTDDIGYSAATATCHLIIPMGVVAANGVSDIALIANIASGYKHNVPIAPYYIFNLNGATTLLAHTTTWTIIQA